MKHTEDQIRRSLITRLLELGYPKSSIVLELGLETGHTSKARIDLAISDPETNKILAIFEIKRTSKDLSGAVQQVLIFSKILPKNTLAFIYTFDGESADIYSVNTETNNVSQVYDIPTLEYLKRSYSSPIKEQYEKLKKKKNTAKTWSNIVAGMSSSIAVAITIAMATGMLFSENKTLNNSDLTVKIASLENEEELLKTQLISLQNEISQLQNSLASISSLPEGYEWKVEANDMKHSISVISAKLESLERALTVDPAKALAVPILRKDLDNAEKSFKAELFQTRAEIDRMYDQNKWFIGLMLTIALSVLGMAASSFFNRKDT